MSMLSNASASDIIDRVASVPMDGYSRIPAGCICFIDHSVIRWPISDYEGYEETDPDMLFELKRGHSLECTAPGFGAKGDYGNGSILIKLGHWKEAWGAGRVLLAASVGRGA